MDWLVSGSGTNGGATANDAAASEWEGLVVLDECHKAKNFAPGKEAASTKVRGRPGGSSPGRDGSHVSHLHLHALRTLVAPLVHVASVAPTRPLRLPHAHTYPAPPWLSPCCPCAPAHSRQVAAAVIELQARLPRARVLYCSATGISEVRRVQPARKEGERASARYVQQGVAPQTQPAGRDEVGAGWKRDSDQTM